MGSRVVANFLDDLDMDKIGAAPIVWPAFPGCGPGPIPDARFDAVEERLGDARSSTYDCGSDRFTFTVFRYPPRMNARPLFSLLGTTTEPAGWNLLNTMSLPGGSGPKAPLWRVTKTGEGDRYRIVAAALWVNGRPATAGSAARVDQALNSLRLSAVSPVVTTVTYEGKGSPGDPWHSMIDFLAKTGPVSEFVRTLSVVR
jgi:hypothetical protein